MNNIITGLVDTLDNMRGNISWFQEATKMNRATTTIPGAMIDRTIGH
jgi:hypothetical protein